MQRGIRVVKVWHISFGNQKFGPLTPPSGKRRRRRRSFGVFLLIDTGVILIGDVIMTNQYLVLADMKSVSFENDL